MPLKTLAPNMTIYEKGAVANEIALIVKGSATLHVGSHNITIDAGGIIGLCEFIGKQRRFTYTSGTEITIYTYEYTSLKDVPKLLSENSKLAPTITHSMVLNTTALLEVDRQLHKTAKSEYEKLLSDLSGYPALCAKTATQAKDYSHLSNVQNPDFTPRISEWKASFFNALSQEDNLMTRVYSTGTNMCSGFTMQSIDFSMELAEDIHAVLSSLDAFHKETLEFRTEISTLNSESNALDSGEETYHMPSMEDSLSQILLYSGYDDEKSSDLVNAMNRYASISNRAETNDSLRALRRTIAGHYYDVYKAVFVKSLNDTNIPAVIKMFLLYGYMDERIVDEEDIKKLYGFSCAYRYGGGRIVTLYDWLKLVFTKKVAPSLNEFQQDYPTYLKEQRSMGEIDDEEMNRMLRSSSARLDFEMKNLFVLGNRMTFGRISIFIPVFDSQLKMLPLEKSYLSEETLTKEINRIRTIDYSIFYRTKIFYMPNNESIQFFVHEEQTPYIILFPVVGQQMINWQTIEGRVRNSPARMLFPAFFDENVETSFTKVCGEFRWEMCKTEQGVRWIDITDPSLTAEYNDFLQFYKKNNNITKEHKEKIRTTIKKFSNNYKKVFVNDYFYYIQNESAGNMRLLKYVRDIMFKYCPFGKEVRESLSNSPQYEKLIEIRANKTEQKVRPIQNTIAKCANAGEEVPPELEEEVKFLTS